MGEELDSTYQRLFNFWLVVFAVVIGVKLWSSASAVTVETTSGGAPAPAAEPARTLALPDSPGALDSSGSETSPGDTSRSGDAQPRLSEGSPGSGSNPSSPAGSELLDRLNSAEARDLQRVSGIGEVISGRIVDARKRRDGFDSLSAVKEVEGIGRSRLQGIREWLSERNRDRE